VDIRQQIEIGILVCPKTKQRLFFDDNCQWVFTKDRLNKYPIKDQTIPILFIEKDWGEQYVNTSPEMIQEYQPENLAKKDSFLMKVKAKMVQDYRTKTSIKAFHNIFDKQPNNALCLSIGGGPGRPHPVLINLNIGSFPNVDLVADAHMLPYADQSVDAIYCEAVLEHLYNPAQAVKEMYRVLKLGGTVFAVTPFLQAYHGYPHHYQNFTLTGHKYLFESHNFEVTEAGTCVGPIYTMVNLTSVLIHEYTPNFLTWPLQKTWGLIGAFLRPLDRLINYKENSHILAATTYLVGIKSQVRKTLS